MSRDLHLQDESLLEDSPYGDFYGATLEIHPDSSGITPNEDEDEALSKISLSPNKSLIPPATRATPQKKKLQSICLPTLLEYNDAKDFFSFRDHVVEKAIDECTKLLVEPEIDGSFVGKWLLTEITLWDNEKERLLVLTKKTIILIKYDFIALKVLDFRKVPIERIDSVQLGKLIYPSKSLVPRLNGLATGISTVVKGCLLRPLQQRLNKNTPRSQESQPGFCSPQLDFIKFQPEERNHKGIRIQWNGGNPLPFSKKWNPFDDEIPIMTFQSHPLFWHKDEDAAGCSGAIYNVDDFSRCLTQTLQDYHQEHNPGQEDTYFTIVEDPILLENYLGLTSVIYNRNALGFYKVRGKFSF